MSEDERPRGATEEQQDEVEAHGKHLKAANDEGATEGDDEVEAHGHHLRNKPSKA